ncbi:MULTISPECIES: class F sortase [unclassified Streptomyces]|uniref:class F sortase n=1 Tax=unclassified Streptomyces TaxID=2593676 RepID=UPI0036E2589D
MADRPSSPADNQPRTKVLVVAAVAALALVMGLFAGNDTPPDASRASQAPHTAAAAPPAGHSAGKRLPRARPVRLVIPKISVDAPFTDLSIGRNGQLQPPPADDTNLVGWYAGGASPGEAGTSIIAGHVDTATSAAVFADLGELEKGDAFEVRRADGRTASFVVDSAETFDKDNFPSRRVYADTAQAQVRLITCAGDYDHTVRDYTDNLVVFAHLA